MEKAHIIVPNDATPQYVEIDEGLERSVKGSIHIRPGTLELTLDELELIENKHKSVFKSFQVLSRPERPEAAKNESKPTPSSKSTATPAEEAPSGVPDATQIASTKKNR